MNLPAWWPSANPWIIADCLDVMKGMPDKSVNLLFTDPPYNFSGGVRGGGIISERTYIDEINLAFGIDFDPLTFIEQTIRLMDIYNAYFYCSRKLVPIYTKWAEERGYLWDILTWHKNNPIPTKGGHYLPDTEYLIYIKETGATFDTTMPYDFYRKWVFADAPRDVNHPSPKPVEVIDRFIQVSSKIGDIVFDPFLGSGTTLLACRKTQRIGLGCEINPEYEEIIRERSMSQISRIDSFGISGGEPVT